MVIRNDRLDLTVNKVPEQLPDLTMLVVTEMFVQELFHTSINEGQGITVFLPNSF